MAAPVLAQGQQDARVTGCPELFPGPRPLNRGAIPGVAGQGWALWGHSPGSPVLSARCVPRSFVPASWVFWEVTPRPRPCAPE
jgi:hypothetical protein